MGVLACAVGVTALAVSGTGKFGNVQVHAELDPDTKPGEYSVTFDGSKSTTVQEIDDNYAICTTTAGGNKVGVVGFNDDFEFLHFGEVHFAELNLHDATSTLINDDAEDFDHITGFKISFSGGSLQFVKFPHETVFNSVTSGLRYDVSITPEDDPTFARDEHSHDNITISSLTIYYTC